MVDNAASPLGHAMGLSPAHIFAGHNRGPADHIGDQYYSLAAYSHYYYIAF
jgi:hypothetical protein